MTEKPRLPATIWLDLDTAILHKDRSEIALTPRAFALLYYLVTHPNQILSTEELLEAVWPNRYVNDTEVRHYIRDLRKVLDDNIKAPRFIETVHGKGYRLIGTLTTTAPKVMASLSASITIGRQEELKQLNQWLTHSLDGKSQVVFMLGEPGVGKTTLMRDFLGLLPKREEIQIACGQCIESYGQGEPFMPVLAALEELCRSSSGVEVKRCLEKYAPLWLLQLHEHIESEKLEKLQERTQGATLARMLRELDNALMMLTSDKGLILWLDDLHWGDVSTLTLIDYLARRQHPIKLLLIATTRSLEMVEYSHPLVCLLTELRLHRYCHELVVEPFDQTAVGKYLDLAFPGLPPSLPSIVHHHTNGNPLFIENIMEDLQHRSLIYEKEGRWTLTNDLKYLELGIPATLRRLIAQRFEQLTEDERKLLMAAAIAGVEFSAATLSAALSWDVARVEMCCVGLVRQNRFLRLNGEENWPDGTLTGGYAFSHALYQQALYEETTPGWRRNTHFLIASRLEQGYAGHSEEIATMLALHFECCGDFARAVHYLRIAAQVASYRQAMNEACQHLKKALSLLPYLPPGSKRDQQELTLLVAFGHPLTAITSWASTELERTYIRAHELSLVSGDKRQLFTVLWGLWACRVMRAEYKVAHESAAELNDIATRLADDELCLEAHLASGLTNLWTGRFIDALKDFDRTLMIFGANRHGQHAWIYGQNPIVMSLAHRAWLHWWMGFPARAHQDIADAMKEGQNCEHSHSLLFAMVYKLLINLYLFDIRALSDGAKQTFCLANNLHFNQFIAFSKIFEGWALTHLGEGEAGINLMQDYFKIYLDTGARRGESLFRTLLAEAHESIGQTSRGLTLIEEAINASKINGERFYMAEAYRVKGYLLHRTGKNTEAEKCFQRAISIARHQSARTLELRAANNLAQLWKDQDKQREAYVLLSKVCSYFTDDFVTPDLSFTKLLLDELAQNQGVQS